MYFNVARTSLNGQQTSVCFRSHVYKARPRNSNTNTEHMNTARRMYLTEENDMNVARP